MGIIYIFFLGWMENYMLVISGYLLGSVIFFV